MHARVRVCVCMCVRTTARYYLSGVIHLLFEMGYTVVGVTIAVLKHHNQSYLYRKGFV